MFWSDAHKVTGTEGGHTFFFSLTLPPIAEQGFKGNYI